MGRPEQGLPEGWEPPASGRVRRVSASQGFVVFGLLLLLGFLYVATTVVFWSFEQVARAWGVG